MVKRKDMARFKGHTSEAYSACFYSATTNTTATADVKVDIPATNEEAAIDAATAETEAAYEANAAEATSNFSTITSETFTLSKKGSYTNINEASSKNT